jgi:acyl transferase domain-containing protein
MQSLPGGSMLAVSAAANEVERFLPGDLSIAAVNSPALCVVSGEDDAVSRFVVKLTERDIASRLLHTSHAFHSTMMDPIVADFAAKVRPVELHPSQIPIASTVTGTWAQPEEMTAPEYWTRNLRQTVRFSDAVQELLKDPNRVLLEVGPGNTLGTCARQHLKGSGKRVVLSTVRHPLEQSSDLAYLLNTLGKLWMHGADVDWTGFYKNERRRRVPLPTYPFERQRYWIEPARHSSGHEPARKQPEKNQNIDQWFYAPSWKRADLPGRSTGRVPSSIDDRVLLFLDKQGLGTELTSLLRQNGQHVTVVEAGTNFRQIADGSFTINPMEQRDYRALWDALAASNKLPASIVHLWCFSDKSNEPSLADSYERYRILGFNSLLFLTQTIAAKPSGANVRIEVVSNHLQEVTGNEFLSPAKAIVLGPCVVASQEHLDIHCSNVDIEDGPIGECARLLLKELRAKSGDIAVAYRGKHRWVQTLEHISLPKIQPETLPLQQGAVCLITGGLGGIGLALADHLAEQVRAKLVLISRSGLPGREQWPKWLQTHGEDDDVCRKIRAIQSIEARGSQVLVLRADVTDAAEMRSAFTLARERFGAIHSVIHAAGIRGDRAAIAKKTSEAAASTMAPKVLGTVVLGEMVREAKPDFFLLCSSLSVQLGGIGNVDYSAANAFLDVYAQKHRSEMNITSIDWAGWQEVGMGASAQIPDYLKWQREQSLKQGIAPQEGIEAFDRLIGSSLAQVVVSPQELTGSFADAGAGSSAAAATPAGGEPQREPAHERPAISSEYVAPGNSTEQAIAEIWEELLGLSTVGIYDNFFELGGHSLLAAGLLTRLKSAFPIELSIASLFENPTVHSLSEMVRQGNRGPESFAESKSRGQKRREARSRA